VQLVSRGAVPVADLVSVPAGLCTTPCDASCGELARPSALDDAGVRAVPGPGGARHHPPVAAGALSEVVRIAATGEGVLVVVADVARRRGLVRHALHPARFGLQGALLFSRRCADAALDARLAVAADGAWLALVDHDTLARRPELGAAFRHVAVLDPPASAAAQQALDGLPEGVDVHALAGPQEAAMARRLHEARAPRAVAAAVWRALQEGGSTADALHERLLATPGAPDAGECAWALEVLVEAGLATRDGATYERSTTAPGRVDLTAIPAFAAAADVHADGLRVLGGEPLPVAV
jgi:hypothetical protein